MTTYAFDAHGLLSEIRYADQSVRKYTPAFGRRLFNDLAPGTGGETNPVQLPRSEELTTEILDGLGHPSSFLPGRYGTAVESTDELGRTTKREVGADGAVRMVTSPDGSRFVAYHDERGNVIQSYEESRDGQKNFITNGFDSEGRLLWSDHGGTRFLTNTYL